jgi:hypothetical protein
MYFISQALNNDDKNSFLKNIKQKIDDEVKNFKNDNNFQINFKDSVIQDFEITYNEGENEKKLCYFHTEFKKLTEKMNISKELKKINFWTLKSTSCEYDIYLFNKLINVGKNNNQCKQNCKDLLIKQNGTNNNYSKVFIKDNKLKCKKLEYAQKGSSYEYRQEYNLTPKKICGFFTDVEKDESYCTDDCDTILIYKKLVEFKHDIEIKEFDIDDIKNTNDKRKKYQEIIDKYVPES